jgi:hypothetical protein
MLVGHRRRSALGALVAAALLVTACGGDDDGTGATTPPPVTDGEGAEPTTPPDEPEEQTTVPDDTDPPDDAPDESGDGVSAFTGTDRFCTAVDDYDASANTASEEGVTADTITFVHVRSKLEELANIGFGVDVGDVTAVWQAFVDEINDCGGINGRQLEMITVEYSLLDPASRDGVCVAAAEDNTPFAVLSSTSLQGSANNCLVEDKRIPTFNTQGVRLSLYEDGYYITTDFPQDIVGRAVAHALIDTGELEGLRIGFVTSDQANVNQIVDTEMRQAFTDAGLDVASFDVLGCAGASQCTDGLTTAVENLIDADVDVLLPAGLNITTLPTLLSEIAVQDPGFRPIIYNLGLVSMAGDLPTSKIADFAGQPGIDLYQNARILSFEKTGAWRVDPSFDSGAFSEMCAETYAQRGGPRYEVADEAIKYGMVGSICSQIRVFARAAEATGADLTRPGFVEAVQNLGEVDVLNDTGGDLRPGKTWFANSLRRLEAVFPCPEDDSIFQGCLIPVDLEATPVD